MQSILKIVLFAFGTGFGIIALSNFSLGVAEFVRRRRNVKDLIS